MSGCILYRNARRPRRILDKHDAYQLQWPSCVLFASRSALYPSWQHSPSRGLGTLLQTSPTGAAIFSQDRSLARSVNHSSPISAIDLVLLRVFRGVVGPSVSDVPCLGIGYDLTPLPSHHPHNSTFLTSSPSSIFGSSYTAYHGTLEIIFGIVTEGILTVSRLSPA